MPAATEVFVSDLLKVRHATLFAELRREFSRVGVPLREIEGTRDIWCRDYMPVAVDGGRFVQFRYAPDYLADAPELITPPEVAAGLVKTPRQSELVVDGGNVVRRGRVAVVTERVFVENPALTQRAVIRQLSDDLEVDRLVVIPIEPGDVLGHADGVLHLVEDRLALVNDYRRSDPGYGQALARILGDHGIEVVRVPYAPDITSRSPIPSAMGVYVNLVETDEAIFAPVYRTSTDDLAHSVIANAFAGRPVVVAIDCRTIAVAGASLHCVTWV